MMVVAGRFAVWRKHHFPRALGLGVDLPVGHQRILGYIKPPAHEVSIADLVVAEGFAGRYLGVASAGTDEDRGIRRVFGNQFIQQDLNVEIETFNRADAERLIANAPNMARLPKTEKLRIVTIHGQIPIPCGGTHVRKLKEIGTLEVTRTEPAEAGFRLHFQVN